MPIPPAPANAAPRRLSVANFQDGRQNHDQFTHLTSHAFRDLWTLPAVRTFSWQLVGAFTQWVVEAPHWGNIEDYMLPFYCPNPNGVNGSQLLGDHMNDHFPQDWGYDNEVVSIGIRVF